MCALKSTPSESSTTYPNTQPRPKSGPGDTVKRWLRLNSFGGRLFWMIMLGALVGMGGMAFLFSEMLKRQAEDQVQGSIDSKVNAIASVTESAETLAYSLGVSATTLHERQAQFPDTYRELVLQLFRERPEFVVGLGLGQSENGLIVDQPWLFPYYSGPAVATAADSPAELSELGSIRYEDFADDEGEFYPDSQRYQDYFEPQFNGWTVPYETQDRRQLTYYYPLTDSDGDWLGSTLVDIDSTYLSNLLDDVVFQKAGSFILTTRSGQIIANPQESQPPAQTDETILGLEDIWPSVDADAPGFLKGAQGFWAYAPVPGQDWLLFGFVPYQAIYGRIVRIAALTTGAMGLLLAAVVYLAIRKLNQRIKPILLQANQFASTDQSLVASSKQHDELEQLSLSFFNMLNQINLHQETIRRHEDAIAQSNLHADQVTERFLAFTAQIDEEASEQQALIQKVQTQLSEQSQAYEAVDGRLDALFAMAQTLAEFLKTTPSQAEAGQLFNTLEQRIHGLKNVLTHTDNPEQGQALVSQLQTDIDNLKTYSQQHHALEQLQPQASDITATRQATLAESQTMVTAAQGINQILAEIESITLTLNQNAKQVSDILWGDLQQADLIIPGSIQGITDLETDLQSLDQAIATEENSLALDSSQLQALEQTIATDGPAPRPQVATGVANTPAEGESDLQQLDQAIANEVQKQEFSDLDDPWE